MVLQRTVLLFGRDVTFCCQEVVSKMSIEAAELSYRNGICENSVRLGLGRSRPSQPYLPSGCDISGRHDRHEQVYHRYFRPNARPESFTSHWCGVSVCARRQTEVLRKLNTIKLMGT